MRAPWHQRHDGVCQQPTEGGRKAQETLHDFSELALHGMLRQISAVTNQIQNFHPALVVGDAARNYLDCLSSEETRWHLRVSDEKPSN